MVVVVVAVEEALERVDDAVLEGPISEEGRVLREVVRVTGVSDEPEPELALVLDSTSSLTELTVLLMAVDLLFRPLTLAERPREGPAVVLLPTVVLDERCNEDPVLVPD